MAWAVFVALFLYYDYDELGSDTRSLGYSLQVWAFPVAREKPFVFTFGCSDRIAAANRVRKGLQV
jgi:hypothetical protein